MSVPGGVFFVSDRYVVGIASLAAVSVDSVLFSNALFRRTGLLAA